jgi:hypothetical protein
MTERTAEEWGRLAVSLPGWRWMRGMLEQRTGERYEDGDGPWIVGKRPDPDDPATAGCLLALLGPTPSEGYMAHVMPPSSAVVKWRIHMNTAQIGPLSAYGSTLGRACIAAAEALGRWPNSGRMVAE